MLLSDLGNSVSVRTVCPLSIFHAQRKPPELYQLALLVEFVDHLLNGIAGESIRARIPVAIGIKPAVIQRGPLNAQLFQLRNRVHHLRGRDVEFITPSAPAHVVGFAGRLRKVPSFLGEDTRPESQGLVIVTGEYRDEAAGRGEAFPGFEGDIGGHDHRGADSRIGGHFYRERKRQRQSLNVSDSFANRTRPESY